MPRNKRTRASNPNPCGIGPNYNQRKTNQTKNEPKPNPSANNKTSPVDELEDFVQHFLNSWKEQYPNPKFWNDLFDFMMPFKSLDNSQLSAVMADFSAAIGQQIQYFRFHPFGSTMTGLAFRGKYYILS